MNKVLIALLLVLLQSCCLFDKGDCDPNRVEQNGIELSQLTSKAELPSKITVSFKADLRDGKPMPGITKDDLSIYEDDVLISTFESQPKIITKTTNYAFSTVLLLDLSGSILGNNSLPALKQASKSFVNSLFVNATNGTYEMAIYWFDGETNIHELRTFTSNKNSLLEGIDSIDPDISNDNSTNLNGAVVQGVELLGDRITSLKTPTLAVVAGALVLFTDGTDQAARTTEAAALNAVTTASKDISIFTIGLGGEINKTTLSSIGRDGTEFADQTSTLTVAFDNLSKLVIDESLSYYIFQYCSPKRNGNHELKLEVIKNMKQGSVSKTFSASGFTGGCTVD